MKKNILFLFLTILIYCCTPKAKVATGPEFTDADVQRGKAFWSECSVEQLQSAKSLYEGKCGSCHALKKPSSEDEVRWRKMVPPMAQKAKITAAEEALILNYVLTMREAKK